MLEAGTAASEGAERTLQRGGGTVRGDFHRSELCASRRRTAVSSVTDMNCPATRLRDLSSSDDRVMGVIMVTSDYSRHNFYITHALHYDKM